MIPLPEEQFRDTSLRFYHIQKFVYDKDENVNDKLISVYDALHELEGTDILLITGSETGISFYLGTYSRTKAALCGDILERGLKGNFPGSSLKRMKTSAISTLLDDSVTHGSSSGFSFGGWSTGNNQSRTSGYSSGSS